MDGLRGHEILTWRDIEDRITSLAIGPRAVFGGGLLNRININIVHSTPTLTLMHSLSFQHHVVCYAAMSE